MFKTALATMQAEHDAEVLMHASAMSCCGWGLMVFKMLPDVRCQVHSIRSAKAHEAAGTMGIALPLSHLLGCRRIGAGGSSAWGGRLRISRLGVIRVCLARPCKCRGLTMCPSASMGSPANRHGP